jgi:hypothetical protein
MQILVYVSLYSPVLDYTNSGLSMSRSPSKERQETYVTPTNALFYTVELGYDVMNGTAYVVSL